MRVFAFSPDVDQLWSRHPSLGRAYLLFVLGTIATALVFATSNDDRLASAAFEVVRATGGGPAWAVLSAAAAIVLLVAPTRGPTWCSVGLRVAAGIYALQAVGFAHAAATSPRASWIGCVAWGLWSLHMLSIAAEHRPAPTPRGDRR